MNLFEYSDPSDVRERNSAEFVAEMPAAITTVDELMNALFDCMKLPGYFGANWNALSDCLRDLHWIKERRVFLVHVDVPALPLEDLGAYLDVLATAAASWQAEEEHSFHPVFPPDSAAVLGKILK